MQKYFVVVLGTCLLAGAAMAQMASGNVSESANPKADAINAQNFRARTVEGCVVQQGSGYLLVPRRGRPEELTSATGASLSESVGRQVKVQGRETYAGDDSVADYAVAAEQVAVVAQSCPANWNAKWTTR